MTVELDSLSGERSVNHVIIPVEFIDGRFPRSALHHAGAGGRDRMMHAPLNVASMPVCNSSKVCTTLYHHNV